MKPYLYRVALQDSHLGLAPDQILSIVPGEPEAVQVVWPRRRMLPPNYGYLIGLMESGAIKPIHRATFIRALDAAFARRPPPKRQPVVPPRTLVRATSAAVSRP